MKKHFGFSSFLVLVFFFLSCTGDQFNENNRVPDVLVNRTINLNFPSGSSLNEPGGNAVFEGGVRGIIVFNLDGTHFAAFDLACPHRSPSLCVQPMEWEPRSLELVCACEGERVAYNALSPFADYQGKTYEMEQYKVIRVSENTLQITNF